jgi:histidine triad (HIT) family protein
VSDCVFCEIVAGRAPATLVPTNFLGVIAFVPLCPVVEGHVLFVPHRHVVDGAENPLLTALTFQAAAQHAQVLGGPFNLITSAGRAATQSVDHLHVHYVPRAVDDQLMVPWGTLHGEDPKAPHRCRGMVALEEQLAEVRG